MQTSRLKNIIILTLLLVNCFLLGTLGMRKMQQLSTRQQATDELIALFASDGVALSQSAIFFGAPPDALTLTRDTAGERAMAAGLLGDGLTSSDEGGGILTFTSGVGRAVFRSSGTFEITGSLGDSPALLGGEFCKAYGYAVPDAWFDASGSGSVSARLEYLGYPVEGCAATFVAEDGNLRSISGTFLPKTYTVSQDGASLNALTALTLFLEARRTAGAVVSEVTDLYPCYTFQSNTSSMTLTPTWCIVTDTVNYYVNCSTGTVSRG